MGKLVGEKRLNKLFNNDIGKKKISCEGKCIVCGCDTKLTISRTYGGYGFQNGVLCETEIGQLLVKCVHCFESEKIQNLPQNLHDMCSIFN
jgi:formate dehydrogenase maturation protein FdhE